MIGPCDCENKPCALCAAVEKNLAERKERRRIELGLQPGESFCKCTCECSQCRSWNFTKCEVEAELRKRAGNE